MAATISFKANYMDGIIANGGDIFISDEEITFKAHALNFDTSSHTMPIKDIIGYKKKLLTFMTIFFANGRKWDLAVWKKDQIIAELESRRRNYFKSRGEEMPPLKIR